MNFVLVEFTKWFDNIERHVLGKPADVVVGLDGVTHGRLGFNPVGSNRALDGVLRPAFFLLVLKNSNEQFTDDLALLLRFGDALERLEISVSRLTVMRLMPWASSKASICSVSSFRMKPVSTYTQ